jgi:hypothetical protein
MPNQWYIPSSMPRIGTKAVIEVVDVKSILNLLVFFRILLGLKIAQLIKDK